MSGFTSHNIRLADGTETMPGRPLLEEEGVFRAALYALRLLVPAGGAVVDLGALEAGYTIGFARAGYIATAIEGRAENADRAQVAITQSGVPARLVRDDARNLAQYGPFDAVFASGILYHFDDPVAFIRTAASVAPVLLLNTHYAPDKDDHPAVGLSPLTAQGGYRGRWFEDPPGVWAAVGNSRSFWLCHRDLLQALVDNGFSFVCEQFSHRAHQVEDGFHEAMSRALFIAVRMEGR